MCACVTEAFGVLSSSVCMIESGCHTYKSVRARGVGGWWGCFENLSCGAAERAGKVKP